jgi:hypothetical protein
MPAAFSTAVGETFAASQDSRNRLSNGGCITGQCRISAATASAFMRSSENAGLRYTRRMLSVITQGDIL